MAKWSADKANWTPVNVNDASDFTDSGYVALQGGSTTQVLYVSEISMSGLATSQSPMAIAFSIDHVVGASALAGVLNAALDRSTAALAAPPLAFSASTTKPQRSASLQILQPEFNAFGGDYRWTALEPSHRIGILGNVADAGELSISCISGTPGAMSSHIIYEPL
jgi:hypothetical protein